MVKKKKKSYFPFIWGIHQKGTPEGSINIKHEISPNIFGGSGNIWKHEKEGGWPLGAKTNLLS